MNTREIERGLQHLRSKVEEIEKRRSRHLEHVELRKRWGKSPWRFAAPPTLAYLAALVFYTLVHDFERLESWQRAIGPVLIVMTFLITRPLIRRAWFRYHRRRLHTDAESSHTRL